jgi:hypothetical protein
MIVRRRYVIGGAVVVALLAGLLITLLMTPQYTAVATIEIARESNKITDIQGVERESNVADQEFYQTQYGLLRSRSLAERAAAQLRIVDDPKFYERFGFSSKRPEFELVNGKFRASGRADRQRAAGEVLLQPRCGILATCRERLGVQLHPGDACAALSGHVLCTILPRNPPCPAEGEAGGVRA